MDIVMILSALMDWAKELVVQYRMGYIGAAVVSIYAFYTAYKEDINWIVLRVQKDSEDGEWSNKEKEDAAVDYYFTRLLVRLPLFLKFMAIVPRFIVEPLIRKIVRAICERAASLKKAEPKPEEPKPEVK